MQRTHKYSLYPIQYPELWQMYLTQRKLFWQPEDIPFDADLQDIKKLTPDEFQYIKMVLAFFAQSDSQVLENLAIRFYADAEDYPEARFFYAMQAAVEAIHGEVYSEFIDTYVDTDEEKAKLFNAIENFPTIAKKSQWAEKWLGSNASFAERVVAMAAVEGIFFSGSFCSIYWLKSRNILKESLGLGNEWIARDEGIHWIFATIFYRVANMYVPEEQIQKIIKEAVDIECEFVTSILPVRMIGMNSDMMQQYVKYTADRVVQNFGIGKIYDVENPFDFMRMIELDQKTNFFENRVSSYAQPEDKNINFNVEDF